LNSNDRKIYSSFMIDLSLRHLRTFLAVAEAGSFRKASERIHLSQPAVTAHIQQLEAAVGVRLLDRTSRQVALTEEGRRFRNRAARALDELTAAVAELREEALLQRGRVRIAALPTMAAGPVPAAMARFRALHPGILVQMRDSIAARLESDLLAGATDLVIGPRPREGGSFDFRLLARDRFMAVLPKDHRLAGRKRVAFATLVKEPVLAMAKGTSMREVLDAGLAAQGLAIAPVCEVDHPYTLGGMVEAGLGVAAIPQLGLGMLAGPKVRILPADPAIFREIGIITVKGKGLSPAAAAFVALFEQVLADWRN
jgi:DNA-binding transcriptional LysR family regulator